jgi:hypothetical protein
MLDVDQELSQAPFDRFQLGDPRVRSIELLDQLGDTVLELAEGGVIAARELHPLDLVGQSSDDGFELVRHALTALVITCRERISERSDTLFERIEDAVVPRWARPLDLAGQGVHFVGEARQSVIGSDLGDDPSESDDCAFELVQRGGILAVLGEGIDLLRQRMQLAINPG